MILNENHFFINQINIYKKNLKILLFSFPFSKLLHKSHSTTKTLLTLNKTHLILIISLATHYKIKRLIHSGGIKSNQITLFKLFKIVKR